MENYIVVICPHCNCNILIYEKEINCAIFRHAIYKNNFTQINPHTTKEECEKLINSNKIIGCGKPFKLEKINNNYVAIDCDYI